MQTVKKFLPWILFIIAAAAAIMYLQKYNKEKAKVLNTDNLNAAPVTGGIAGGIDSMETIEVM